VRIAYASSRMQPSPVSSSSTPFPSCGSAFLLSISIFPPAVAPSLFILPFASISHSPHRRVPSFFPPRTHRRLSSAPFFFAHSPPRRPSSSRPFSHSYIRSGKALPYLKNNPRRHISCDLYTYVKKWKGAAVYSQPRPDCPLSSYSSFGVTSVVFFPPRLFTRKLARDTAEREAPSLYRAACTCVCNPSRSPEEGRWVV